MSLDCALAKSGYGEMGIAGTIAGPLFNLMIGFGLSSLQILIKNKGYKKIYFHKFFFIEIRLI